MSNNTATSAMRARLAVTPTRPGVYLFKADDETILYVGKAVNLRNRLRSYFRPRLDSVKVQRLMANATDFETIVCATELEALVLECNLIKKHRPKYNVRLRDDKHYPYIKVSMNEDWPRVYVTRRIAKDGARYFGPFTDSRSVWRTLDLLNKLFPYRTCHITITGTDPRPCLQYHIKRCLGPCIGAVQRDEYLAVMDQVCLFLDGRHELILAGLRDKMDSAAEHLQFERAAFFRDQIQAVEKVSERQKVLSVAMKDQDVVAFARNNGDACVQVFFIRGGKLIGREHFLLEGTNDEDSKSILTSFVTQFYDAAAFIPPEILLQNELAEADVIQSWLRDRRGDKVSIQVPRRGEKRQLVDMVADNATEVLTQMRAKWLADEAKTTGALRELAEHLDLPDAPRRVECYDISNIQGTSAVGAMVVFENGQPRPSAYRRFQIKTVAGANDFAMLQEVLTRRFRRASADGGSSTQTDSEHAKWKDLPDLVIIDGGRGQLNAALGTMHKLGLGSINVVGLAKQHEEIFTPTSPESIMLPRDSQSLYLVQRIRDETHRFAVTYHRVVRAKRATRSALDDVPRIGPRRRASLLRAFGSVAAIRQAEEDALLQVPGMDRAAVSALREHLASEV